MLDALFSNSHVEKALLFLFINKRAYPSQMKTALKASLTPLQHALKRLESFEVVQSKLVGKNRIYSLNPKYPLHQELKALLKKAYSYKTNQEKQAYFSPDGLAGLSEREKDSHLKREQLIEFWTLLKEVKHLKFQAQDLDQSPPQKRLGLAEVEKKLGNSNQIIFEEKGFWYEKELPSSGFSNAFRWTLDFKNIRISIEHLRYGPQKPVFLFYLTPDGDKNLGSHACHECNQDLYLAKCSFKRKQIHLKWRIIGPKKNQFLSYQYS